MSTEPLASTSDVADMWRSLTLDEVSRVARLIDKASAKLRQKAPYVDARIAAWQAGDTRKGLDPTTVATVVATVVKRFISNPEGIASQTQGAGPFSAAVSYALRTDKYARGELQVTDEDIAELQTYSVRARVGMMRLRPALAPRPVGRYGGISGPAEAIGAAVTYGRGIPRTGAEFLDLPVFPDDPST